MEESELNLEEKKIFSDKELIKQLEIKNSQKLELIKSQVKLKRKVDLI
ncbi:20646_t:CDS:2, partial [Rhizophagus irregularis]